MLTFDVLLELPEGGRETATFIVPFDAAAEFGARGQIRIRGTYTFEGRRVDYRSSLFPIGDGRHYTVVNRPQREAIGAKADDTIHVTMALDTEERIVDVPDDLAALLEQHPAAAGAWGTMTYSAQKEYVDWINDAKRPETRQRRLTTTIERVTAGLRKG